MKIIKVIGTMVLGLVLSAYLSAAEKNQGIDMLRLGEYDLAKQFFTEALGQDKAKALYYLGEVEWEQGNMPEAAAKYNEALNADPESFYAQVGVAKVDLKQNPKEAKKALENIYKKNKKDVQLILEVAKAFYDNEMNEDADKAVSEARKADNKSPLIYILLGDRALKAGKAGDAAMQYDQAINFDNTNVLALIKAGKVYENINSNVASELLKKASEVDPSNRLVNRYLAKVYSQNGRYAQATKIYADYFMEGSYNLEDIRYFSNALYFNKNYSEAREILNLGLEKDKDNFVFNRLLMYVEYELKDLDKGLEVAKHFFTLRADQDNGYLDKDYVTYGKLLAESGNIDEAVMAFTKAVELNPDNIELYKELASTMSADKLYEPAADFQNRYIQAKGGAADATEYYQLGRFYQSAAAAIKDTIPEALDKRIGLFKKADMAFEVLTEKRPDNYLGYYMRAGVNSMLDPQLKEGLAKPFYEKALELIEAAGEMEQRQNIVLTVYEYLAVYYFYDFADTNSKESKQTAKEYCEKYLNLNPDKESMKSMLENLEQQ